MKSVYYKKGYKYQSTREFTIQTEFVGQLIETDFCRIDESGLLTVFAKYCHDGATGFPDFGWIFRGAFVHDVGYQLIRSGAMPRECRLKWDALLGQCCIEDGAYRWVAASVEKTVNKVGKAAAHPNNRRRELCAP